MNNCISFSESLFTFGKAIRFLFDIFSIRLGEEPTDFAGLKRTKSLLEIVFS